MLLAAAPTVLSSTARSENRFAANSPDVLRSRVIRDPNELFELVPAWWDLARAASRLEPTQTPAWLLSWWRVFGSAGGRELFVVVVEDARGQLVAIAPFVRRWVVRASLVPLATLEWMGSGEDEADEICSEYLGALVRAGHEARAAATIARCLAASAGDAWDVLELRANKGDDPTLAVLGATLERAGASVDVHETESCPFIALPDSFDRYLEGLDGERRYFARRTLRDFDKFASERGGATLHVARAHEPAFERGFEILRRLHDARWGGGGVFDSARFSAFHAELSASLGAVDPSRAKEAGTLALVWIEVGGEPLAIAYDIEHRGRVYFYQGGRRMDLPKHVRPGIALHLRSIELAIERGASSYDFLARADTYKRKLAPTHAHELVTLEAVAPTVRARASRGLVTAAHAIAKVARRISSPRQSGSGTTNGMTQSTS